MWCRCDPRRPRRSYRRPRRSYRRAGLVRHVPATSTRRRMRSRDVAQRGSGPKQQFSYSVSESGWLQLASVSAGLPVATGARESRVGSRVARLRPPDPREPVPTGASDAVASRVGPVPCGGGVLHGSGQVGVGMQGRGGRYRLRCAASRCRGRPRDRRGRGHFYFVLTYRKNAVDSKTRQQGTQYGYAQHGNAKGAFRDRLGQFGDGNTDGASHWGTALPCISAVQRSRSHRVAEWFAQIDARGAQGHVTGRARRCDSVGAGKRRARQAASLGAT